MGQLQRAGVFHAFAVERGVDLTGPNELLTFAARFRVFEEKGADGQFVPVDGGEEITGYSYLVKKDGTLNESAKTSLKAAFGWDGRDPFWLQDAALDEHAVQITTEFEEYEGKQRLKVKWINPYGSTGSGAVKRADAAKAQEIKNRYGAMFRAHAGGVPATPPRPAGSPTPPPASTPKPPATPPAAPPAGCSMDDAWAAFAASPGGQKCDQARLEGEWFRVLTAMFPGKAPTDLTPQEWAKVRADGPAEIVPF